MCGGTSGAVLECGRREGLSPRVRGNRPVTSTPETAVGSIPACAGEPLTLFDTGRRYQVYPRVCGGTPFHSSSGPTACGLSPRVRGNLGGRTSASGVAGSIPACAGEPP